jgi:hypothetical protein
MRETGRDWQRDMPSVRNKGDEREANALAGWTGCATPNHETQRPA